MEEKVEKDVSICWEREKKKKENGEVEQEKREKKEKKGVEKNQETIFSRFFFLFSFFSPRRSEKCFQIFF